MSYFEITIATYMAFILMFCYFMWSELRDLKIASERRDAMHDKNWIMLAEGISKHVGGKGE